MKKISIAASCYNEELNIDEFYKRVSFELEKYKDKYEFDFIFSDNDSSDNTAQKLKNLAKNDKRVKVILNSRNFGHIKSPYNTVISSDSDAVILMASDMQDPPELIPALIEKWENGNKVVLLQKISSNENPIMFSIRKFYYKFISKISDNGVNLAQNCTGSGLIDKCVVDYLKKIDDPYPYYRGLICEVGYKRDYVQFNQPLRKNGITANNLYSLYDMAMTGIVKNSKIPLRFMAILGFIMSIITFLLTIFYFVWKLIYWDTFSMGIAPIIMSVMFIGSIQLFCLGILGEYVAAIYTRVDKKPLVVEKEKINF